jgi:hypothetical protein
VGGYFGTNKLKEFYERVLVSVAGESFTVNQAGYGNGPKPPVARAAARARAEFNVQNLSSPCEK